MNRISRLFFAFSIVFAVLPGMVQANTYTIDKGHTTIGFSVRHMVISNVRGQFNNFEGTFVFDPNNIDLTSASVKIDAASIDTNEAKRDEHLRTPEFLDVKKFPDITFELKSFMKHGNNEVMGKGDITIRGITKTIALKGEFIGAVKDPWGNERVGFSATGEIDRKEFGLTWNKVLETGGVVVGDKVTLIIEVEGIKKK
ncbi:MAG: YceI family protein [Nitrospinota bacterium]|nr:YceI family protein [Nitrospinota bacterium]